MHFFEQAKSYYHGLEVDRSYVNTSEWGTFIFALGARQGELFGQTSTSLRKNLNDKEF